MRENMPMKIRSGNQGEDLSRKICLGSAGKGGFLFKRKKKQTLPTTVSSLLSSILSASLTHL